MTFLSALQEALFKLYITLSRNPYLARFWKERALNLTILLAPVFLLMIRVPFSLVKTSLTPLFSISAYLFIFFLLYSYFFNKLPGFYYKIYTSQFFEGFLWIGCIAERFFFQGKSRTICLSLSFLLLLLSYFANFLSPLTVALLRTALSFYLCLRMIVFCEDRRKGEEIPEISAFTKVLKVYTCPSLDRNKEFLFYFTSFLVYIVEAVGFIEHHWGKSQNPETDNGLPLPPSKEDGIRPAPKSIFKIGALRIWGILVRGLG